MTPTADGLGTGSGHHRKKSLALRGELSEAQALSALIRVIRGSPFSRTPEDPRTTD
jgi:hypothetical protein